MNIGKNIKMMRERNGMEQKDLAERLNLSNKTISSWECGRTEPKMGMIEAMCEIFNCEKTTLIDGLPLNIRSLEIPEDEVIIQEFTQRFSRLPRNLQENVMQYITFLEIQGENNTWDALLKGE